jgi:hypothetical protein
MSTPQTRPYRRRVSGVQGAVTLELMFTSATRLLRATPEGELTVEEYARVLEHIVSDPALGGDLPTLWDLRDRDFTSCTADRCRSLAFVLLRVPGRRGARRAFLVASSDGFGSMRMFQQTVSGFALEDQDHFHVSYDLNEALEWLIA